MPFELIKAFAIFQKFISNILRKYLNVFCIIYLDDILIYNCIRKKAFKPCSQDARILLQR
jgi:hypothetical protein